MHIGGGGCPTHWEYSYDSPVLDTFIYQELLDGREMGIIATIHTGEDVKLNLWMSHQHIYRLRNHIEAILVASHPVVLLAQAIHTNGHGMETSTEQIIEFLRSKI